MSELTEVSNMVYEKLCALLADQLGVSVEDITPDTNIVDDLGADSLDVVELLAALEEEYNIMITDERVRDMFTVKDVADFVEALL